VSYLRHIYYELKPHLPLSFRVLLRQQMAKRKRARTGDTWPINPGAGLVPKSWSGWPEGKKFALILTHDVESATGIERVKDLGDLEMALGFRSSFNFIPEASYNVPPQTVEYLLKNDFEIGVHDLKHDGKLYRSKPEFSHAAVRINRYLSEWNARGFRSGFMHHNLDWLHELDIDYDMSTFDTDPFEPQPDGVNTIFPFWVSSHAVDEPRGRQGYAELPYTIPQDFTLFVLLKEPNINIWKRKLDWIAQNGGMALLNTHPDYMFFTKTKHTYQYPADHYKEFLNYVQSKYEGTFWKALPRDVARHTNETQQASNQNELGSQNACSARPRC
jgi:hypothetical protein